MGEVFARRYELMEPVAEGGMGSVWLVRDHQDGDVKVAKILRHSDAGSLLRFMREQSTRIHHPHVVTPLSWVGEDDSVLFTMPLVRGGSVATLVGDWGPLPEPWVRTIVGQTLEALAAVHAARVVHRDVKPANLLLEPTGAARPHVRLTDFGIAAPMDEPRLTQAATTLGTPGYLAPERRDGASPDPRQDLFAVGTVGIEMLVGHPPPFAADELPTTPLGRLLARAADPDPDRRPASAEEMAAELAALEPGPSRWDPGEVEVLDHFSGPAWPDLATARPTTVLGPAESESEPEPEPGAVRPVGPGFAVVALAVLGVGLIAVAVALLVLG